MTTAEAHAALMNAEDAAADAGRELRNAAAALARSRVLANRVRHSTASAALDAALEIVEAARLTLERAQEAAAIEATRAADAAAAVQPTLF